MIVAKSCLGVPGAARHQQVDENRLSHVRLQTRQASPARHLCTKRQMLLGGVSLFVAPWLAQRAEARSSLWSLSESPSPLLNGFDGEGGNDADYANAEVFTCMPALHCVM